MKNKKQIVVALLVFFGLVLVLAVVKYFQISAAIAQGEMMKPPPDAVTSTVVKQSSWPITRSAVGTLVAVDGATLSSEEFGRVAKVNFESGTKVEKGTVLVELDTSVEQAQLNGALAQLELATLTAKRQRTLRERNANAQSDLDSAEASLRNATAEVERLRALINRKKVIAPFAGHAGIRMVNVGETIQAGTTVVSLQSFDTLHVNFSLPQSALSELTVGSKVNLSIDAFPGEVFEASLTAIDSQVDQSTRNISLQATAKNPHQKLKPGMFAGITVVLPQEENVIAIPSSSVNFAPYGDSVFIIEKAEAGAENGPRNTRIQTVKSGKRIGDLVAIESGLKPGDEVVSSGVFRLRPGSQVVVNNSVSPGSELNPTPSDT